MPRRDRLLILLFAAVVFVPPIFTRDLWSPDEPRYAEVAREMRVTGEWIVPHLNGDIYTQKPPLFFWLSALLQPLFGFAAGRVIGAAAAAGTALLVHAIALRWFSPRASFLAALVLLSTLLFAWVAHFGVLDVPLAFFTTLAVWGYLRSPPWLYVGAALGVLVKGPVAILIVALTVVAFRLAGLKQEGRRATHLVWGVPIVLAIVGAWLVPACLRGGGDYTRAILFTQNVGRVANSWSHPRPLWYYLESLPLYWLPWTLVAPWALVWGWRRGREEPALRALILWLALGILVFSAISGKRERYLLPLYPAFALVIGRFLDHAAGALRESPRFSWLVRAQHAGYWIFGAGFALVCGTGALLARPVEPHSPEAAAVLRGLAEPPAVLLGIAGGAGLAALSWRGRRRVIDGSLDRAIVLVPLAMGACSLLLNLVLVPQLDRFKSPQFAAEAILRVDPPAEGDVAFYESDFAGAYNLYSRRLHFPILYGPEEVVAYLGASAPHVVVATEKDLEGELRDVARLYHVTPVRRVGHREVVFLSNFQP